MTQSPEKRDPVDVLDQIATRLWDDAEPQRPCERCLDMAASMQWEATTLRAWLARYGPFMRAAIGFCDTQQRELERMGDPGWWHTVETKPMQEAYRTALREPEQAEEGKS